MNKPLAEQIALVTGGTRGIGRSIAERFLEAGMRVLICSRSQEQVEKALGEMGHPDRAAGMACDVAKHEDVVELFRFLAQRFGGLDVLVNNAGVGLFQPVDQITPGDWRRIIETNLSGVFYCTREAAPLLKKQGGGYIINIGSLAGKNAMAGGAAYNASKFGLIGLSEASMLDLRNDNIRVSCIMPGSVATEFGGSGGGEEWKIGPDDIAETALYLLRLPERTMASRVEVRPTRPARR